ncbi:transposase [Nocardia aurantia]|uniref:Transposase n=1 Tax=Nocardia aurantia TaxID=2585199 RepID=A0A7K0DPD8_9NOCA|nr:transposase [Nocardia aurantia]MQY27468.1 hypothetical protein [Nocardia aurantia]
MAGRKRHSPEEIVNKLRRAEVLAAAGASRNQIAAELEVSVATLSNWRRQYAGAGPETSRELQRLREQNARLERLLIEAVLEKDALRRAVDGRW